ncbi:MAG: YceI family protein [Bacteroidota bacterium]|jgi:polyisoprenoid-binding protein YceI|nr:MAG: polyisoprenoid-binding protein [Bacteroidota bacterium]
MKKMKFLLIALLASGTAFAQTTWTIDKAHSKIGFNVLHMAISEVEGEFTDFDAKVVSKSDDFHDADVEFTAKVASIDTENERRDNHLKSDDFFNAEKFPEIKFKGKLVKEGNAYKLKGDFTMRDVTKPVTFDVVYGGTIDTGRGMKAGFKVTGTINRKDYNLKWDNRLAGGELVVSDDVDIVCKIEMNKA